MKNCGVNIFITRLSNSHIINILTDIHLIWLFLSGWKKCIVTVHAGAIYHHYVRSTSIIQTWSNVPLSIDGLMLGPRMWTSWRCFHSHLPFLFPLGPSYAHCAAKAISMLNAGSLSMCMGKHVHLLQGAVVILI